MKWFARLMARQLRWWARQWDDHPYRMTVFFVVQTVLPTVLRYQAMKAERAKRRAADKDPFRAVMEKVRADLARQREAR